DANREAARLRIRKDLRLPDNALIVLGCGTIDRRKGVDIFAEVARRLFTTGKANTANVYFVWVGGGLGPDRYDSAHYWVQRQLVEHGLEDRVLFVGQKSDPEPYFL